MSLFGKQKMAMFCIVLFCISLIFCIVANINVVFAIFFGLIIFVFYAFYRKHSVKKVYKMCKKGFLTSKNVILTFSLIAMLTGCWRCSGTIPAIVCFLLRFVSYKYFVLITFLLCSFMSMVTGSLLASAMTIGLICMTIAKSIGANEVYIMGAILSGAIVGDRMSPVSSSCLLVAELTNTDMYDNIKNMFKTSIIPFIITCVLYFLLGVYNNNLVEKNIDITNVFMRNYNINILSYIPIISIIVLSLFRVNIKINVLVSLVLGIIISFVNEKIDVMVLLRSLILGYKTDNMELKNIINGGGLISVKNPIMLVAICATFSGIFKETDILDFFNKITVKMIKNTTKYMTLIIYGIIFSVIGCNQTFPVIMVDQLVNEEFDNKKELALFMENSVIIIPMLVPWNTACKTCVESVGGSFVAILFTFYVFVLLIYNMILNRKKNLIGRIKEFVGYKVFKKSEY